MKVLHSLLEEQPILPNLVKLGFQKNLKSAIYCALNWLSILSLNVNDNFQTRIEQFFEDIILKWNIIC